MTEPDAVSENYGIGHVLDRILAALEKLGKSPDSVTIEDLAAVDEFHIGGRQASEDLLAQLGLSSADRVLDIGCGLGGTARLMADRYHCRVDGIDRTGEYVAAARTLSSWTRLSRQIEFCQGSATCLPFAAEAFDAACMLHVGMNIDDKAALWAEVHRVLRPGARFGIYDVMRTGQGDLAFPVPWAADPAASHLHSPQAYRQALKECGFAVISERNRRDFALAFFNEVRARLVAAGPPVLGLQLLMGPSTGARMQNIMSGVSAGLVAPVEIVVQKCH
ncbi:MAG: class I SAM-dependent methyltransferase [Acidiferrobacterales bacterium]